MKTLVVGGGGREHALCWVLAQHTKVYCAPGNPGTAAHATNLPVALSDHQGVLDVVREHGIDLTVVGPEAPLADGLADHLEAGGHAVFGPSAAAARIEASKAFAKDVMRAAGVPTARSEVFTDPRTALAYAESHAEPLVVKASGLAGGKGALVCDTRADAAAAVTAMFDGRFGEAGREVVIEDFLEGEEVSVFALTDGDHVLLLPASQDHKRLRDGDTGPNTGGMGAYTPVSIATETLMARVKREILLPTLEELRRRDARFRGVLYAGLMISPSGDPFVVEFNCRFGDPEAQVVLPVADTELTDHLWRIGADEPWNPPDTTVQPTSAGVTTVLAAAGYPDAPQKGAALAIPESVPPDTALFHAGTARDATGALRASGGRVLCATGFGIDVAAAAHRSRTLAEAVRFEGAQLRSDIGWREVARARTA